MSSAQLLAVGPTQGCSSSAFTPCWGLCAATPTWMETHTSNTSSTIALLLGGGGDQGAQPLECDCAAFNVDLLQQHLASSVQAVGPVPPSTTAFYSVVTAINPANATSPPPPVSNVIQITYVLNLTSAAASSTSCTVFYCVRFGTSAVLGSSPQQLSCARQPHQQNVDMFLGGAWWAILVGVVIVACVVSSLAAVSRSGSRRPPPRAFPPATTPAEEVDDRASSESIAPATVVYGVGGGGAMPIPLATAVEIELQHPPLPPPAALNNNNNNNSKSTPGVVQDAGTMV